MKKISEKKQGGIRNNFAYTIQIVQILGHILAMKVSILVKGTKYSNISMDGKQISKAILIFLSYTWNHCSSTSKQLQNAAF